MDVFFPKYYTEFRCLAAACPDSCCQEWEVDVDEEAAQYYRSLPGALGNALRAVLRQENGGTVMTITDRRCPMWQPDGLCRIQAELGHEALCKTCREFPRLTHDYGDFTELGLELSCPEAARLLLSAADSSLEAVQQPGGEAPDYDREAMVLLRSSREMALSFLDGGRYAMGDTLASLLLYAHNVQSALDGGPLLPFDPADCLEKARRYGKKGSMADMFAFFRGLESLTPRWQARLAQGPQSTSLPEDTRPLARYFIQRYWLQAVSDYDLISRVKLTVSACLLIGALGGNFRETAQLFSKEIENSPENMDALLDGAYTCPAFTDAALLGLLTAD